jgi:protein tyrosine/serine phosphatase
VRHGLKLFPKKVIKKVYKTDSLRGRLETYLAFLWGDHAYLRLVFTNAHWLGDQMVRTNQPWPFQLKWWQQQGIKTVINLRGGKGSFYYLEKDACLRFGLEMVTLGLSSRDVPSREKVLAARDMFQSITYPALMHCKSGADRAGIMAVFYRHFHLGHPISEAKSELSWRTLHARAGKTGILDYIFDHYNADIEPQGISFIDWVMSEAYDPDEIRKGFTASWWGTLLTEKILRRE